MTSWAMLKAFRVELRSSKIIRLWICYACIPNSELGFLLGQSEGNFSHTKIGV